LHKCTHKGRFANGKNRTIRAKSKTNLPRSKISLGQKEKNAVAKK